MNFQITKIKNPQTKCIQANFIKSKKNLKLNKKFKENQVSEDKISSKRCKHKKPLIVHKIKAKAL